MMHCAHCGVGECVLSRSGPTVLRCSNCGTYWTDRDDLAARFTAFEAERAEIRERLASLEQGFVAHCALDHADNQWCAPEEQRDAWRKTFNDSIDKIRDIELAEIDHGKVVVAPTQEPLDTWKLTIDFLTLSFLTRLTILQGLGLITDEEVHSLEDTEAMLIGFRRAKDRDLIKQIRTEIDRTQDSR